PTRFYANRGRTAAQLLTNLGPPPQNRFLLILRQNKATPLGLRETSRSMRSHTGHDPRQCGDAYWLETFSSEIEAHCPQFVLRLSSHSELLDEFFDWSRRSEQKVEPYDVRELVTGAVDKIAISAEFQSGHVVQLVPEGLTLPLNRNRIHRALVNLLV